MAESAYISEEMPTTHASDAALVLPEILETILSGLPERKLFTLKAVSKTWMAIITKSPSLRCKMFLAPDTDVLQAEYKHLSSNQGYEFDDVPLLEFLDMEFAPPLRDHQELSWMALPSFLCTVRCEKLSREDRVIQWVQWTEQVTSLSRTQKAMLLTKPPVDTLLFVVSRLHQCVVETTHCHQGFTIGDVAEGLARMIADLDNRYPQRPGTELPRLRLYTLVAVTNSSDLNR
jgi:hypothetical protein